MQAAVFAKNYSQHLEEAAKIADANAEQLVTFRSAKKWTGAQKLLEKTGPGSIPVLFGVNERGPAIYYRALLREVNLSPRSGEPRAEELLKLRPSTSIHEDPWNGGMQTLYAISGCYELPNPLAYSSLVKQKGTQPLSENFKYSYSLVYLTESGSYEVEPTSVAADITTPPARVEALLSRVVRDTAITLQLKKLHEHHCQICGMRLALTENRGYSEAHHIQPLGRPHDGPDAPENILILCPNCHALCDHLAIRLSKSKLRTNPHHPIGDQFLEYHNQLVQDRRGG